jgi:small subunit ribosomal protein S11
MAEPEITTPIVKKKKNKRVVPQGQVHIKSTFNNTIVTFTDPNGETLTSASAGACGFRGSKKSTAFAAQIAMEKAAGLVKQNFSMTKVDVLVKGLGLGRESAVRSLQTSDIYVNSISDVTGLPHGGCRPRKARRN